VWLVWVLLTRASLRLLFKAQTHCCNHHALKISSCGKKFGGPYLETQNRQEAILPPEQFCAVHRLI
jgi:hypothetical protein